MTSKKGNARKGRKQGEGGKSELEIMEEDESEFVSMVTLKTMLSIQQSTMRSLFESFLSSVNSRVDNLVKTVESIKSSLEFTQKDIADFDPRLAEAEKELKSLQSSLEDQGSKMEYLENQSRRNNIRVSGIPEEPGETWEKVEEKVKAAVKEKLDLDIDIERAHRVEKRKGGNSRRRDDQDKTRTIVCRLKSWKEREAVLRKARKDKPQGLFISEDLARATLEKRAAQVDKLKAAKQAGKTAYFILDRLIIRDKINVSSVSV